MSYAQSVLTASPTVSTAFPKQNFAVVATQAKTHPVLAARIPPSEVVAINGLSRAPGTKITVLFKSAAAQAKVLASPLVVKGVTLVFTDKFAVVRRQGTRYLLMNCPSDLHLGVFKHVLAPYGEVFKATPVTRAGMVMGDRWNVTIELTDHKMLPRKVQFGFCLVTCLPCGVCHKCNKSGHSAKDCPGSPDSVAGITALETTASGPAPGKRPHSDTASTASSAPSSEKADAKKHKNFRKREALRAKKRARQDAMEVDAQSDKTVVDAPTPLEEQSVAESSPAPSADEIAPLDPPATSAAALPPRPSSPLAEAHSSSSDDEMSVK